MSLRPQALIDRAMKRRRPTIENQVHRGLDDWLFLVEGSNSVVDLYRHDSAFTETMARDWVTLLAARHARMKTRGIDYVHLAAPEKLTLLHRFYDGELDNPGGSPICQLADRHAADAPSLLNVVPYLSRHIDDYPIYWKTDTHWSAWGCFLAYQMLCSRLGIASNREILGYPYTEGELTMDLGGKLTPPQREVARFYRLNRHSRRVYANPLVRYKENNGFINEGSLHVGSHVIFENDSASAADKVVVLFGDSFSEYRNHLLTGMLAETVRELHFIWNANIDDEYVRRVRPDIVVTELAERFMTRLPTDDIDIVAVGHKRVEVHREAQRQVPDANRQVRPPRYQRRRLLEPAPTATGGTDATKDTGPNAVEGGTDNAVASSALELVDARDARVYLTADSCLVTAFNGDVLTRHAIAAARDDVLLDEEPTWLRGTTLLLSERSCAGDRVAWFCSVLPKVGLMAKIGMPSDKIDHVVIGRLDSDFQHETLRQLGFDGARVVESDGRPYLACERLLHLALGDVDQTVNLTVGEFVQTWLTEHFAGEAEAFRPAT